MEKQNRLLIRADADTRIGTGHVMRCIALAQAWQDQGGDITFLSHCNSEATRQRIIDEGFGLIPIEKPHPDPSDLTQTLNVLKRHAPCPMPHALWLVVDGYHFTPDFQKAIRDHGHKLLVIDDIAHLDHYHANVLLNQNIHAPRLNYSCDRETIRLLSCKYVMLRREFLEYRNWRREVHEKARKILVTLGGSDPENVTLKVVKALNSLNDFDLEVKIVVGPANPNITNLEKVISDLPYTIHLLHDVNDMPSLMAWADVAVSAAGSTSLELAFMGLPAAMLVLAENQKNIAAGLDKAGVVISLDRYTEVIVEQIADTLQRLIKDHKLRQEMIRRGKELVDGKGSARVVETIL